MCPSSGVLKLPRSDGCSDVCSAIELDHVLHVLNSLMLGGRGSCPVLYSFMLELLQTRRTDGRSRVMHRHSCTLCLKMIK